MAERNECIPYFIHNEVGSDPRHDGGFSDDPDDPGGPTKYGICQRDHPAVDIRNLTLDGAVAIMAAEYWCYDGLSDNCVAAKLLDMAGNMEGTGKAGAAITIAQQAAARLISGENIVVDGKYGPQTEALLNRCDPAKLLAEMASYACLHYRKIEFSNPERFGKYIKGWLARAERIPHYDPQAAAGQRITAAAVLEGAAV